MTLESTPTRDSHNSDRPVNGAEPGSDLPNREERRRWNEESGDTWVRFREHFDATLALWLDVLLDTAAVGKGERVLDVGCGCGTTTLAAGARSTPEGSAVGVDLSEPMTTLARDRARTEEAGNVRFVVGDAQSDDLAADGAYDVVISRFGVMFFEDPQEAFANILGALRPGGRLVMLSWAPAVEQEWLTVPLAAALAHLPMPEVGTDGPGMFGLAEADVISATLDAAGWVDVTIDRCTRSMPLGGGRGVEEAAEFLLATGPGRALMANATPETGGRAVAAVRDGLRPHLTAGGVELEGVAWLTTARRPA